MHLAESSTRTSFGGRSRFGVHAVPAGLLLVASVLICGPTLLHPFSQLPFYMGDGMLTVWNYWWAKHALIDLGTSPFATNLLSYPRTTSLVFHSHDFLHGVLTIPLQLLFGHPRGLVLGTNAVLLLCYWLSALAAYACAWSETRDRFASLAAGVGYGFCAFHTSWYAMPVVSAMYWVPLFVLSLRRALVEPGIAWTVGAGLCVFLCTFQSLYFTTLLALVTGVVIGFHLMRSRFDRHSLSRTLRDRRGSRTGRQPDGGDRRDGPRSYGLRVADSGLPHERGIPLAQFGRPGRSRDSVRQAGLVAFRSRRDVLERLPERSNGAFQRVPIPPGRIDRLRRSHHPDPGGDRREQSPAGLRAPLAGTRGGIPGSRAGTRPTHSRRSLALAVASNALSPAVRGDSRIAGSHVSIPIHVHAVVDLALWVLAAIGIAWLRARLGPGTPRAASTAALAVWLAGEHAYAAPDAFPVGLTQGMQRIAQDERAVSVLELPTSHAFVLEVYSFRQVLHEKPIGRGYLARVSATVGERDRQLDAIGASSAALESVLSEMRPVYVVVHPTLLLTESDRQQARVIEAVLGAHKIFDDGEEIVYSPDPLLPASSAREGGLSSRRCTPDGRRAFRACFR